MPTKKRLLIDSILRSFTQIKTSELLLRGSLFTQSLVKPLFRPADDIDFVADFTFSEKKTDIFVEQMINFSEKEGVNFLHQNFYKENIWIQTPSPGRRYRIFALMDREEIELQIDIAFGDTIFPKNCILDYKDFEGKRIQIPSVAMEQMMAWKTHGLFEFWETDTRWQLKDLYDILLFLRSQKINEDLFDKCLDFAFQDKKTPFSVYQRILDNKFGQSKNTLKKWEKFVNRFEGKIITPNHFELLKEVREFLDPFFTKKMQK